jgi:uncharacterized membrane protein YkoI
MTVLVRRRTLLLALGLSPIGIGVAFGDDDDDDDDNRARRAVEEGRARPLSEILKMIGTRLGGEIVGLELKRKDGRYVYKLKVVTPAGRLREVSVDAATGAIVKDKDD